ncbi:MAG: hypothetical protein RLY97_1294, partial [Pseudomonadota bacterium]
MKTSILSILKTGAAPLVLGAALLSAPAFAQTKPATPAPAAADKEEATIVVTGSILRRT